ncbi:MAG: YigZ family protein [Clostridia bacterium]|nr:YigZ family protein [Clostridia bacterium]
MEYKTIEKESCDEFIEKRSRFIGYIKPVTTKEEAVEYINSIKSKHWDATHNVYAYVLRDGQTRRYSDDGEPQGTAGIPVLDVLIKENVVDCVVVATRYFGGILLGGGGLVRAYSHTAKIAVDAGGVITMRLCSLMNVRCDYTFYGRLNSLIPEFGGVIDDTVFEEDVKIKFHLPADIEGEFNAKLIDSSFGKVKAEKTGEIFCKI